MIVAGIMSGTSADGIDVAIVRIRPRRTISPTDADLKLELLHHKAIPFSPPLRSAILAAMGSAATTTADLARLHWRLGIAYAEAAKAALDQWRSTNSAAPLELIGCHGQTVYHQGKAEKWLGRSFGCTWQIGEPALIARALGVPVISNFRPADMAASGQGAPLVPLIDFVLYRHAKRTRILQNIGGIGNLTVVPAGASLSDVRAFDTGPGNMIIDALMQQLYRKSYDRGGNIASQGSVLAPIITTLLEAPYFRTAPPKSAGREQFGEAYVVDFLSRCRQLAIKPQDILATATSLTAESIALAYKLFVASTVTRTPVDFLVSGGGAKNRTLMSMLRATLEPLGCKVSTLDHVSIPVEAKEAAAFALLAYQTWHHRPGNVPSATGAGSPAILGQVNYV